MSPCPFPTTLTITLQAPPLYLSFNVTKHIELEKLMKLISMQIKKLHLFLFYFHLFQHKITHRILFNTFENKTLLEILTNYFVATNMQIIYTIYFVL